MERIDFGNQTNLTKCFQRFIHGVKGNHRQMAAHFLVNVIGAVLALLLIAGILLALGAALTINV